MAGNGEVVSGTIMTEKIKNTHVEIKKIVDAYAEVTLEVGKITLRAQENWVGKGENEFEAQYKILIRKIEDFGDTLLEIYEALVQSEADYQTSDNDQKQAFNEVAQEFSS